MTKILVIEDEQPLLEEIVDSLTYQGFEVIGASNGAEGVNAALKTPPDLIICDISMPELDGYGVLLRLRSEPQTSLTPFIFLTAKSSKEDMRLGMEMGADDYLTKPFTLSQLQGAIRSRLEKRAHYQQEYDKKLAQLRDSILLTLPHELRTPLTGILGYSELLLTSDDTISPAAMRAMAGHISSSGKRLQRLIENYLLYAQLEVLQTDPERVAALRSHQTGDIRTIISDAALTKARQYGRETDLILELDGHEAKVSHDALKKIAEELIDNAFKFSQTGTAVQVVITVRDQTLTLCVTDYGRGMTPEQLQQVGVGMQFERKLYEQQGAGLGLTLARRLADIYGGQLIIQSVAGQKTSVTADLPVSVGPKAS